MRLTTSAIVPPIRPTLDLGQISSFVELTKPGVTRMVLGTTLCGALVAPTRLDWARLAATLIGMAFVVGSANALNMVLERDTDALMTRTKSRPLPSGRVAWQAATWFAIACGLVGLIVLATSVGAIAAALATAAHLIYVLVYTPLKRVTPLALHIGGIPGALPPVIGWASMTDHLGVGAWAMFLILFMWQLPHFLAISLFRRDEYARAAIAVHPVVWGPSSTKRAIVGYSVGLVLATLWPAQLGLVGPRYSVLALSLGVGFIAIALFGLRSQAGAPWARSLFFASLPYLVVIYGALVVSAAV